MTIKTQFKISALLASLTLSILYFGLAPVQSIETIENQDTVGITFSVTSLIDITDLDMEEIPFVYGYSITRHSMTLIDSISNTFELTLNLIPGTLFKYRYSLAWGNWETYDSKNEAIAEHYRTLLVPKANTTIQDTVYGFTSGIPDGSTTYANITGKILDSSTGQGLEEGGIVWIGGISSKIISNGSFYIPNVVGGLQRMTVLTFDHYPLTLDLTLNPPNSQYHEIFLGEINVDQSPVIKAVFVVDAPEFSETNHLRLIGDLPNTGYLYPYLDDSATVYMQHLFGSYYYTEIDLHAGVPLSYFYTTGNRGLNQELNQHGQENYRKVVFYEDTVVMDKIQSWHQNPFYEMHFHVDVPTSTRPNETVYMMYGNNIIPMTQVSDYSWEVTLYFPGFATTLDYYYQLGEFTAIYNEADYYQGTARQVSVANTSVYDRVEQWRWLNQSMDSGVGDVNITLQVNIPFYTPNGDQLYLVSDSFSNGWSNATGYQLTRLENHLYEANLTLARNVRYDMSVTRGDFSKLATHNFTIHPYYEGQLIHSYIDGWKDLNHPWNRTSFYGGIAIMDWWAHGMRDMVEPTFKRYAENGGVWIKYMLTSEIDHYFPTAFIDDHMPDEDLKFIVDMAHKYNLKVSFQFGLNGENALDGGIGVPAYNTTQWEIFKKQYLEVADHNSRLAQELGVEMLGMPLILTQNETLYDVMMNESIDLVRQNYGGLLTSAIGTSNLAFSFPSKLDVIGIFMWKNFLVGNDNPTVEQLVPEIENVLDTEFKPFVDKFNKTIMISQLAYLSTVGSNYERNNIYWNPGDGGPVYSQVTQARMLEAFFQAAANRTWIGGVFSFGYEWFPLDFAEYSVNYKQAEMVLLKWNTGLNTVSLKLTDTKYFLQSDFILNTGTDYSEIRISTGDNATWSDWISNPGNIDFSNYVVPSNYGGGEFMIILQGRNGMNESLPTSILLRVDQVAPIVSVWNKTSSVVLNSFADDTSLKLEYIIYQDANMMYTGTIYGSIFALPTLGLSAGSYSVMVNATDELGLFSSTQYSFIILAPLPTSSSDSESNSSNTDTSSSSTVSSSTNTVSSQPSPSSSSQTKKGTFPFIPLIFVLVILLVGEGRIFYRRDKYQ